MKTHDRKTTAWIATPGGVRLRLGGVRLSRSQAAALDVGCVIELDEDADGPVELQAGWQRIARGQAVVVDGTLGVLVRQVIGRPTGEGE